MVAFSACRALEAATRCAWGMVTIKLPALSPGWAPISPRLVAEIGATEDHEVAQTYQEVSWPWTVSGLGAVMSDGPGAQEGELTNWADFDAAAPGIEVRASRASEPMEFESLSLRTSHGGIRLSNVAWLAGNGAAPAVIAQAFAGAIVVDGLSAAADAETFHSRGRLTFWAKEGDAKISRVQVSVRNTVTLCPTRSYFKNRAVTIPVYGALWLPGTNVARSAVHARLSLGERCTAARA